MNSRGCVSYSIWTYDRNSNWPLAGILNLWRVPSGVLVLSELSAVGIYGLLRLDHRRLPRKLIKEKGVRNVLIS